MQSINCINALYFIACCCCVTVGMNCSLPTTNNLQQGYCHLGLIDTLGLNFTYFTLPYLLLYFVNIASDPMLLLYFTQVK